MNGATPQVSKQILEGLIIFLEFGSFEGPGWYEKGEGMFLGNPKDSVWEDWGTLGNIREPPPLGSPPPNHPNFFGCGNYLFFLDKGSSHVMILSLDVCGYI